MLQRPNKENEMNLLRKCLINPRFCIRELPKTDANMLARQRDHIIGPLSQHSQTSGNNNDSASLRTYLASQTLLITFLPPFPSV